MKNKKLLICMLAVLGTACLGLAACGEGGGNSSSSSKATVNIEQENGSVNVLGELTLTATSENATEAIVWSSSDPSIATVENGVVTALNVGTVTITASADGAQDTCTVEVIRSEEAPVITLNRSEWSIGKDMEYVVTANVSWLGNDVTDKVTLEWSLGADAQDGIASLTAGENGEAVLKGLAVGETVYYVSTTIGDAYVNSKISVKVIDASVSFDSEEVSMGESGNFEMTMGTKDSEGNPMSVAAPVISVYQNGEAVDGATFVWESSDESIVKVEDGNFIAQRAGSVDVHGTYNDYLVTVTLHIERALLQLNEELTFDLSRLHAQKLESKTDGVGEDVLLDGKAIGSFTDGKISLNADALPTAVSELGARDVIVNTDQAAYAMTINLYTMVITTAEDLNNWHKHAYANGDTGYYVLGANIDFNGAYTGSRTWENNAESYRWVNPDDTGFAGIFDGQGYNIDGLSIERNWSGFITLLTGSGIIRNVSFTNAKLNAYGGYVCTWGCGTIENVYVQYSGQFGNSNLSGTFMAANNSRAMKGYMTVKNCYIDATQVTAVGSGALTWVGGYCLAVTGGWTTVENAYTKLNGVYVLADKNTGNPIVRHEGLVTGSADYGVFASTDAIAADGAAQAELATWNTEYWSVENGVPVFKAKEDPVSFSSGLETDENGYYTMSAEMAADSQNLTAVDIPAVSVYENGVLSENAEIDWESTDESIIKVEGGKLVLTGVGSVELQGYYKGYVVRVIVKVTLKAALQSDTFVFDISDLQAMPITTNVQGVVDGVYLSGAKVGTYADGKITLDKALLPTQGSKLGAQQIAIYTDVAAYAYDVEIYSMVIDTKEELNGWHAHAFANGDDGYYALGANIAFNDSYTGGRPWTNTDGAYKWANPDTTGFAGVFDGRGYTIDGMDINTNWSSFVTLLRAEGVIKNVAFTNATLTAQYGSFVCTWGCGTIENVYVQYKDTYGKGGYAGTFFATDNTRNMTGKLTVKDCYVDASAVTTSYSYGCWIGGVYISGSVASTNVDIQGVYVMYAANEANKTLVRYEDGVGEYAGHHAATEFAADSAAQTELATWNTTYWTITSGVPVWNTKA